MEDEIFLKNHELYLVLREFEYFVLSLEDFLAFFVERDLEVETVDQHSPVRRHALSALSERRYFLRRRLRPGPESVLLQFVVLDCVQRGDVQSGDSFFLVGVNYLLDKFDVADDERVENVILRV